MSMEPGETNASEEWQMPDMQPSERMCHRLLIAIDDSRVMNRLKQIFPDDRFDLAFASNGLEALCKVRSFSPHCLLTKPYLPGMNGLMLTRMVKFDKRYRTIPVIMRLSGMTESMRSALQKVGVDDVLIQPCDHQTVMKTVINQVYSSFIEPKHNDPVPVDQVESIADIVW